MSAAHDELDAIEPGSLRANVLDASRRFKASWVELAKHLVRVRTEGLWEEWGYASFEAYCAKELRIKKATAQKLVMSHGFLQKHEPKVLKDDEAARRAPSFEVLEVLAKAEEQGRLSDETYRDVRASLWEKPVDPGTVKRELDRRSPPPEPDEEPVDLTLARLAKAAQRLAKELAACKKVPRAVVERAEALAEDVEALS